MKLVLKLDLVFVMRNNVPKVYLVADLHKTLNLKQMKIEVQNSNKPQKPQLNILAVMCRTFSNMFFWFGLQLFDSRLKEYGGFNHFIAGKIFRWKYCYLSIALRKQWRFEWIHEIDDYYYDGYHNSITIGCLQISYGT